MLIMFETLKKKVESKIVRFLEVYINMSDYQRVYSSYYQILKLKKACKQP